MLDLDQKLRIDLVSWSSDIVSYVKGRLIPSSCSLQIFLPAYGRIVPFLVLVRTIDSYWSHSIQQSPWSWKKNFILRTEETTYSCREECWPYYRASTDARRRGWRSTPELFPEQQHFRLWTGWRIRQGHLNLKTENEEFILNHFRFNSTQW